MARIQHLGSRAEASRQRPRVRPLPGARGGKLGGVRADCESARDTSGDQDELRRVAIRDSCAPRRPDRPNPGRHRLRSSDRESRPFLCRRRRSEHYQLTLPPHLELTDVELAAWRPLDVLRELIFDEPLPQATYAQFVRGFDPRTHIYERGAKPVASGTLHVGIRVERTGVMTGFVVAAAIITAVLVGYWRVTGRAVNAGSSTSIAALLLAPGLVAAYLARPGEHAIVRRLLVFPRVVLALSGGLTLVAAAALQILGPQSSSDAHRAVARRV